MILNSFFIIPLLTHILNTKEVSIYLIALQILNLICTLSFDWIAKAVLRFYEKYDLQERQNEFLSTIFWLSVFVYLIVFALYIFSKDILTTRFAVSNIVFALTIILVIPCGIRQALYQILRTKNNYMLYTASIIIYQLLFIAGFLALTNLLSNAAAIILAMIAAIMMIDIYIFYSLNLKTQIKFIFNKKMLFETMKYALPLVLTSFCYWALFHTPKLIFQSSGQYLNTSVFGIAWTLATNTLNPIASLFMFVNFPLIIKNFEHNKNIKTYVTSVIQIYLFILFPLLAGICFFSSDIVNIILPKEYHAVTVYFPIFAIMIFLHEMMKLINIKYHLKNNTYIETIFGTIIIAFSCIINMHILINSPILGAIIMIITEIILILINVQVRFKNLNFINYRKVINTIVKLILTVTMCGIIVEFGFNNINNIVAIIKIIAYLLMTYTVLYGLRKKILF